MNSKNFFLFVIIATFVPGCAHRLVSYGGQKPNLSLAGEAAQKEVRRFELEEDSSLCAFPCFKYDAQKRQHTWESIQPLLESVSPQAMQQYEKAKFWRSVQTYSLGFGIAGLVAALATNGRRQDDLFALSTLASVVSIGSGIYAGSIRSNIPGTYNYELKEKFIPTVGITWPLQ